VVVLMSGVSSFLIHSIDRGVATCICFVNQSINRWMIK
jgi:hypothetical protein